MNFFENLAQFNIAHFKLEVLFNDGNATVVVIPKNPTNDDALNALKPLVISENITQLDQVFFDEIKKPLSMVSDSFTNALSFQATLEEQNRKTKEAKSIEESYQKLKTKLQKLKDVEDLNDDKVIKKATSLIADIKALKPKCSLALEMEKELSQNSLF